MIYLYCIVCKQDRSVNGVFVNDVRVKRAVLAHGDVIVFGGGGGAAESVAVGGRLQQPETEFAFRFGRLVCSAIVLRCYVFCIALLT